MKASWEDPLTTFRVNAEGTLNVLLANYSRLRKYFAFLAPRFTVRFRNLSCHN